jgi:hypothetical protein
MAINGIVGRSEAIVNAPVKVAVVSYSMTGNNQALAERVTKEFAAEHIRIAEPKRRTMGKIVLDLLFNRTPKVQPAPDKLGDYDLLLFIAPVWLGQVAFPLRAYLKHLKANPRRYAFISISGGADGPNPELAGGLLKRVGKEPVALIDLHIADLLPPDPKPTRQMTMDYRLNAGDLEKLTTTIVSAMNEKVPGLEAAAQHA